MSTNGINGPEDSEMADCDGDKVVTMMDVLQEQQDFEEDANAVLGASDDKNCTYPKGYIKRQALYACLTCCEDAKIDPMKRAGVCLACSLTCHENHELVELYTKRNFRCDCGNPKFKHSCQFTSNKTEHNSDNNYNQNFSGLYCVCHKPYPDPDATCEDDMIQCIVCEDWLHASHLDATVPANDQYSEMICKACMEKNEFLHDYSSIAVNVETGEVDVVNVNGNDAVYNGDLEKRIDNTKSSEAATENMNDDVEMTDPEIKVANSTEAKSDDASGESKDSTKPDNESEKPERNTDVKVTDLDTECQNAVTEQSFEKVKEDTDKPEEKAKTESEENVKDVEKSTVVIGAPPLNEQDNNKKLETDNTASNDDSELKTKKDTTENIPESELEQNKQEQFTVANEQDNKDKIVDIPEKTEEQQLLDDLNELTSDARDSGSTEPKTNDDDNEKPANDITSNEGEISKIEESSAENENKTVLTDSNVDNTSQIDKESTDKTDAVMDAIDEILEGTDKVFQGKENSEASEQITTDAQVEEKSNDVEMIDETPKQVESSNAECDASKRVEIDDTSKTEAMHNETKITNESAVGNKDDDEDVEGAKMETENNKSSEILDNKDTFDKADSDKTVNESDTKEITHESTNEDEHQNENSTKKNVDIAITTNENKRKLNHESEDLATKKPKLKETKHCMRPRDVKKVFKGATFWPSNFRQKLCTCGECIEMYKDLNVLFLTDLEDTVTAYERLGKENIAGGVSQYEKGLEALSSLDRIQQINALTEYNKMRDKLLDFLKSFKDRKEIVKEEDIKAFFAGMKPRREPDGVYFCR